MLPSCLCPLFLTSPSYFLVKVNFLIWSPPGHRGPSPRAKPLCHTSYGKFLRGHAAPQPLLDRLQDSQTASPLLLGVATLWAWLQVGMVLTPLVRALFCGMKQRETPDKSSSTLIICDKRNLKMLNGEASFFKVKATPFSIVEHPHRRDWRYVTVVKITAASLPHVALTRGCMSTPR